jgi:hypothetical protein
MGTERLMEDNLLFKNKINDIWKFRVTFATQERRYIQCLGRGRGVMGEKEPLGDKQTWIREG